MGIEILQMPQVWARWGLGDFMIVNDQVNGYFKTKKNAFTNMGMPVMITNIGTFITKVVLI